MSLLINAAETERDMLVTVEGEVDVSNAPELRDALDGALACAAGLEDKRVRIDISQVPYIDSTGIGVLVGTVHRGEDQGVAVCVERPQRNVARILGLLGLDAELGVRDATE